MDKDALIELIETVKNDFDQHSEGCGLEDERIQDRYEAMEYGFNRAIEAAKEMIENSDIETTDQN